MLVFMRLEKKALTDFYNLPMSPLEAAEKIECIRYLEKWKNHKNGRDLRS